MIELKHPFTTCDCDSISKKCDKFEVILINTVPLSHFRFMHIHINMFVRYFI